MFSRWLKIRKNLFFKLYSLSPEGKLYKAHPLFWSFLLKRLSFFFFCDYNGHNLAEGGIFNEFERVSWDRRTKFVKDGMTVGLRNWVNSLLFSERNLGCQVNEEVLKITGVVTSSKTEQQAKELGIPLKQSMM